MNLTQLNEKQYEMLKRAYNKATKEGQEQFEIQGQPVLTKFAKYLLEYLENQRRATGQRIFNPEIHDITCPKCGFEWTSRVESPKTCPSCKARIHHKVG
jgi:predicted Zn-ribbon and HTH transcriptional regulator